MDYITRAHQLIPLLMTFERGGGTLSESMRKQLEEYRQNKELNEYYFTDRSDEPEPPVCNSPEERWIEFIRRYPEQIDRHIPVTKHFNWMMGYNIDRWDSYCRRNASKAFDILCKLHEEKNWPEQYWIIALIAWEVEYKRRVANPERHNESTFDLDILPLFSFLNTLPARRLDSILQPALRLLNSALKEFVEPNDESEELLNKFLSKVLGIIKTHNADSNFLSINDNINHIADNFPAGTAAIIMLHYQFSKAPKYGDGLHAIPKRHLKRLLDTKITPYLSGRYLIANSAVDWFLYDRNWAEKNVLPLFSWEKNPDEAKFMWQGYFWSAHWTPDFLNELRDDFLQAIDGLNQNDNSARQYARLVTSLALKNEPVFKTEEYKQCISKFNMKNRIASLGAVKDHFTVASDYKRLWASSIKPFFENVWPQDKDFFADELSQGFDDIISAAEDARRDVKKTLKILREKATASSQQTLKPKKLTESKSQYVLPSIGPQDHRMSK